MPTCRTDRVRRPRAIASSVRGDDSRSYRRYGAGSDTQVAASSATPTTSSFTGGNGLVLGYGLYDFSSAIIRFAGELDDVRLWQMERSAADIAASHAVEISAATAGLQGYWKLDGSGTSTVVTDETAGAANGTLVNFTFTADGGPASPWVTPGAV